MHEFKFESLFAIFAIHSAICDEKGVFHLTKDKYLPYTTFCPLNYVMKVRNTEYYLGIPYRIHIHCLSPEICGRKPTCKLMTLYEECDSIGNYMAKLNYTGAVGDSIDVQCCKYNLPAEFEGLTEKCRKLRIPEAIYADKKPKPDTTDYTAVKVEANLPAVVIQSATNWQSGGIFLTHIMWLNINSTDLVKSVHKIPGVGYMLEVCNPGCRKKPAAATDSKSKKSTEAVQKANQYSPKKRL